MDDFLKRSVETNNDLIYLGNGRYVSKKVLSKALNIFLTNGKIDCPLIYNVYNIKGNRVYQ